MIVPDTTFALAGAVFWAISARILGRAMAAIPGPDKLPAVIAGLMVSLVSGSVALLPVAGVELMTAEVSPWLAVAGVVTFPIGTGLYYLCGHAFAGRVEFASQFANVKPVLAVGFAVLFLGESLRASSLVALVLIAAGIALLLVATRRGTFNWAAFGLGVLLALAWSVREIFAKLGLVAISSLAGTLAALLWGTAAAAVLALPYVLARRAVAFAGFARWGGAFALHGIFSFAVAYACVFESLQRIGVGRTVLISAFWPGLAVVFGWIEGRLTGRPATLSPVAVAATALLLAGSLVQVLGAMP